MKSCELRILTSAAITRLLFEPSLTDHFPPKAKDEQTIAAILAAFACIIPLKSATYVSAPITTGPRFLNWRRAHGSILSPKTAEYDAAHSKHVIEPNSAAASGTIQAIRARSVEPIIDPTAFQGPKSWSQADYRDFWGRVIEKYVSKVVFLEGWNYSSGCAYEFLVACRNGIPTLDANEHRLSLSKALDLIDDAIRDLGDSGIPSQFIVGVRLELQKHVA